MKRIPSNEQPRDRSSWLFALRCWLVAIGCSLLVGLAGCGPAGSGNAPSPSTRVGVDRASSASGKGTVPGANNAGQGDKLLAKPAGKPNVETDGGEKLPAPVIPDSISKALNSSDARVRFQALDYWATQGTTAPLDPLLEALEDEDKDVRTKAAKIAEQHWGIKQELD